MKIEKLNEDKIRITLNMEDLKENDIDFHSFMSNSVESQELFMDMLDKAEKEIGFKTEDYRVMIEALAMKNGNFVLTVTRLAEEKAKNIYKKKKLNIKRKSPEINSKKAIYCFESFDEFCDYCHFINDDILTIVEELANRISLYQYNEKYYLVFENLNMNVNLLKSFSSSITEFARFINGSILFESKLTEYGSIVFQDHAISQCFKHFC